jgi:hypothetical protein
MGLRFYRRVRLCPGFSLNLSRYGVSTPFGRRGAVQCCPQTGQGNTPSSPKTGGIPRTGYYEPCRPSYACLRGVASP